MTAPTDDAVVPLKRGRQSLGSTVAQAMRRLNRRMDQQWPERGKGWNPDGRGEIRPGEWVGDALGLPPKCPVRPLGYEGTTYYFVDAMGQLFAAGDKAFGREVILKVFGAAVDYLYWAWPSQSSKGTGARWAPEAVQETLFRAAARRGIWNPVDQVRGVGAWRGPDGGLVLHLGDEVWVNGKPQEPGEVDGYLYPAGKPVPKPVEGACGDDVNPAPQILQILQSWNWRRGRVSATASEPAAPAIDALLMFGWLIQSMIGGALDWRTHVFLVGDRGIGKSTLQDLVRQVLAGLVLHSEDASEAFVATELGRDSRPVSIDEMESDPNNPRPDNMVKLARIASSGGSRGRSSSSHNTIRMTLRSPFLFSSINPPPMREQDLSRIMFLHLKPLPDGTTRKAFRLENPQAWLPLLLRRVMDACGPLDRVSNSGGFMLTLQAYREALAEAGHDARAQMTIGTLLACAHLAMGDEAMEAAGFPVESFAAWGQWLPKADTGEANWSQCLTWLLSQRIEAIRGGERLSVAQIIDEVRVSDRGDIGGRVLGDAAKLLQGIGLSLVRPSPSSRPNSGLVLCVPRDHPVTARLFDGTNFRAAAGGSSGAWAMALEQAPAMVLLRAYRVMRAGREIADNRVSISGMQRRCVLIDLDALQAMQDVDG